jgi:4-cresol dehydrogenase (hydroxylating) flavoprotein subunit
MPSSTRPPFTLSHVPAENTTVDETLKRWADALEKTRAVESLPAGISPGQWTSILEQFRVAIGRDSVIAGNNHELNYGDPFALSKDEDEKRGSSAALRPTTVEQVQAILKIANEHKIPLWTFSRGKNLGYGGSAGRVKVCTL